MNLCGRIVRAMWWLPVSAAIVTSSAPAAAQVVQWLPQPADSLLPLFARMDVPTPLAATWRSARPAPEAPGRGLLAGYLVGAAIGLRLGEAARPPEEMGLFLRGWYRGATISDPLDRPYSAVSAYGLPAAVGIHGADPPFVDGVLRGFLATLATTARD